MIGVPYGRIVAEVESWPFVSDAAFRGALTEVRRSEPFLLDRRTLGVWRALERHLLARAGGMSVDVLSKVRDRSWFHEDERRTSLARALHFLAGFYLEDRGSYVRLRHDARLHVRERAERWRWLSLRLPDDLMIAALRASGPLPPRCQRVRVVSPQLAQVLSIGGMAQTHLHVGSSPHFGLLWTALMVHFRDARLSAERLERAGPPPFGDARSFTEHLLVAAVARVLLAAFLVRPGRGWAGFIDGELPRIARRMRYPGGARSALRDLRALLAALSNAEGCLPLARLELLYRTLTRQSVLRPVRGLNDLIGRDPIASVFPKAGTALPETVLTWAGLRRMMNSPEEPGLATTFWQYERIRGLTFQHLVQMPGTSGLDYFRRFYDRISALRVPLEPVLVEAALETESQEGALRSLEVRTSPAPRWQEVMATARRIVAVSGQSQEGGVDAPELGLVLHFIKRDTVGRGPTRRHHADPRSRAYGCRYGAYFAARTREANAIERALWARPEILFVLRGMDAASSELAVPCWVLAPLMQRVRRVSIEAANELKMRYPHELVRPMRATFHAGEDFRHLISGLRAIHEPIAAGILTAGDRIGHAVALGVDPETWTSRYRVVAQTIDEQLDDLLWELDCYADGVIDIDPGRIETTRAAATAIGRSLFDGVDGWQTSNIDADLLRDMRKLRSQPRVLCDRLKYPYMRGAKPRPGRDAEELLRVYLTSPTVYERGAQVGEVRTEGSVAVIRELQKYLRTQIASLELTIETNPSSNLLVGDFPSLEDHPAFRLHPLAGPAGEAHALISINDDNPLSFSTCLADEYAHFYYAMIRSGVSASSALAWIDRVREVGLRSRFTLPASRYAKRYLPTRR